VRSRRGASARRERRRGGVGPAWAHKPQAWVAMLARAQSAGARARETNHMDHGTARWILYIRRSGTGSL
jgi:hypothetical protein